ncbi:exopolygalacturonase-like [Amaranthus tricolor]|uniref:exopolygalacturonase-like n=1 Tax=Amaranthus tricolor TaxID=29722 RepID=UPI00258F0F5F|nr:exopolygalacturonase-like [Amaranthus tricolor]
MGNDGRNYTKKTIKKIIFLVFFAVGIILTKAKGRGGIRDGDGISIIPRPDEKVFNIANFDAVGDGETDNVEAFMGAFRAVCDHPGKGRLLIPAGKYAVSQVVFAGPCKTIGPIVVQITGTILAVPDVSMYPEPEWLVFEHISGLVIFGGGVVDGQGAQVWKYADCNSNPDCSRLPSSIVLKDVSNASIRRITSLDPMGFHIFITGSRNIRLQRLHIKAPEDSPNTDGIHISSSDQIKVSRSHIETGDDCIGILQGSTRLAINKITCGPGHGISVGSLGKYEDEEDVRGVQVKNCTIRGTSNGIRIKTFPFKPNIIPIKASGFLFQDIVMDNVKNPIIIDQEYCGRGHSCVNAPSKIKLSDIFFYNIKGSTISPEAINIRCSSAVPCQNVHLHNIHLIGLKGPATATCTNAKVNLFGLLIPSLKC